VGATAIDTPRWRAFVTGLSGALGIGTAMLVGAPVVMATTLATFSTQGRYTWTVPTGVTKVSFAVYGASGGSNTYHLVHMVFTIPGGVGAEAKATFKVKPGEVLQIIVGGHGGDVATGSAAGFNGGGQGGSVGAGGGGGSEVELGGVGDLSCGKEPSGRCTWPDRFIVAGGGGGAGNQSSYVGGAAGGLSGAFDGSGTVPGGDQQCPIGQSVFVGTYDQGGIGTGTGGAGGGGGWCGGSASLGTPIYGAGGGGGSSYIDPFALSGSFPASTHTGDGKVVITSA
jgi:hypothetical protein